MKSLSLLAGPIPAEDTRVWDGGFDMKAKTLYLTLAVVKLSWCDRVWPLLGWHDAWPKDVPFTFSHGAQCQPPARRGRKGQKDPVLA